MKVNIKNCRRSGIKDFVDIENHDVWSLDTTLSKIIFPALLLIRECKNGIPFDVADVGGDSASNQYCFDFYADSHNTAFDIACNNWDEILTKMIWAFQQLAEEDYEDRYHYGEMDYTFIPHKDKFFNPITGKSEECYVMQDRDPSSHWYDSVGQRIHSERIQEGIDLFCKYFRSLWV